MLRSPDTKPALLVSADREVRDSIAATIPKCGLQGLCCSSLSDARALLASQDFSIVFCSDVLPDGDFRALMNDVKKPTARIPVIVLSRSTDWGSWLGALGAGAFDYIACPPEPTETSRIVLAALNEWVRLTPRARAAI